MDHFAVLSKKNDELGRKEVAKILGILPAHVDGFVQGRYKNMKDETKNKIEQTWPETLETTLAGVEPSQAVPPNGTPEVQKPPEMPLLEPQPIPAVPKPVDGRNICLCFPVYKHFESATVMALLAMWDKTKMRVEMRAGDAMIARSRNHLAKRFLETGAEWSFWMDDDVVPPCGSAGLWRFLVGAFNPATRQTNMNHWSAKIPDHFLEKSAIERLMSWDKKIIGGLYFDRWGMGTITAGYSRAPLFSPPVDSIHPVDFVGTGCLLVHRDVYLAIASKFPEVMKQGAPGNETGFFTPIQGEEGRMWGEDQAFGYRAAQAGFQSFLDFGCVCGHVGMQIHGLPTTIQTMR